MKDQTQIINGVPIPNDNPVIDTPYYFDSNGNIIHDTLIQVPTTFANKDNTGIYILLGLLVVAVIL